MFSVFAGSGNGFPRNSALILPLLSAAGFSVLVTQSCDEDDDDEGVGVAEELVDKPWTTNGSELDILQSILLTFLIGCGF